MELIGEMVLSKLFMILSISSIRLLSPNRKHNGPIRAPYSHLKEKYGGLVSGSQLPLTLSSPKPMDDHSTPSAASRLPSDSEIPKIDIKKNRVNLYLNLGVGEQRKRKVEG